MPDNQPSTPDSANVDRTPTGEIADQKQTTTPAATTPQTSTTPDSPDEQPSLINQGEKSLANQTPPPAGPGAPETYSPFNVPDGFVLDEEVAKEAGAMFKERGMTQEQAQKFVDFYVAKQSEAINAPFQVWRDMQAQWQKEVKSDPVIGPRLTHVTQTISRAIDAIGDPKLAQEFRQAMDFTGAGNNPAFIKTFFKLASMITEGSHVSGKGPSPAGQKAPGEGMPSAAKAMYPNLS